MLARLAADNSSKPTPFVAWFNSGVRPHAHTSLVEIMQIKSALLTFVAAIGILAQAVAVASEPADVAKTTYLLIYRPGPAWPQGKPVSELPLRDHGKYMLSLYAKGLMRMAGPLTDNAGGAVVLEVSDEAEAIEIVANDPAVKARIFMHELHPWEPVQWEKHLKK